ncbi:MAG: crossover junction endodeoxyribonuclease RuvC, partial [Bacteroidia bacterium]|nr:crossover junction endodeoxyribonuclease RuvC [Bacteroidia bacterium]
MVKDKIILGIDPGTIVMGYGIIHVIDNKIKPLSIGVIKLDQFDDHAIRLQKI